MAIIQDGNTGSILSRIFSASRGLATMLVGDDGSLLPRASGAARAATDNFLPIAGLNDDNFRSMRVDRLGGIASANANILFREPFEGATISTPNRLTVATTNFTQAQTAAGGLNLNNGAITTVASGVLVNSNRQFLKIQRGPLQCKFRARLGHVANAVMEVGFGLPASQTVSAAVGAYWQVTAGGVVQGVLTFNGVDVPTAAVTMPSGWQNNYYTWDVILDDDEAIFFVQDTGTGQMIAERRIQLAVTQVRLWNATRLPVFARLHFPTAPAGAATLILSSLDVMMLDSIIQKPWSHVQALTGFSADTVPTTFAQSANYSNSAAPSSATLSNTAAGYTTLGGQFQFAAIAGAETDYALFGFTAPSPYCFVLTGIEIETMNTGAAVATIPSTLQWFISPDQTAISLATASNRRTTLGMQSFPIGAAIAALAAPILRDFSVAPLVTNPGRILVIGTKLQLGFATPSQIIRGVVSVKGYFE